MPATAHPGPLDPGRAANPELPIEVWPIDRLHPRRIRTRQNAPAVGPVTGSLERYGWQQNLVVRPDGEIMAGEAVWRAAQAAGYTEVPVHVTHDPEPDARAYALDDNRTHDEAHWHYPRLQAHLTGLADLGVDAGALSFPFDELGQIAALAESGGLAPTAPGPRTNTPTGFVALNVPVLPAQREILVSLLRLLVAQGAAASHADALERICREWVTREPPTPAGAPHGV
jgi:ParB-like nuclease family protein